MLKPKKLERVGGRAGGAGEGAREGTGEGEGAGGGAGGGGGGGGRGADVLNSNSANLFLRLPSNAANNSRIKTLCLLPITKCLCVIVHVTVTPYISSCIEQLSLVISILR